MDFEQFLTEGPVQYLLMLMVVPLFAAIILGGYFFYALNSRQKKSKMKLGTQPLDKNTEQEENEVSEPAESSNLFFSEQTSQKEAGMAGEALDLNLLSRMIGGEDAEEADTQPSPVEAPEQIDLSARLNFDPPEPEPSLPPPPASAPSSGQMPPAPPIPEKPAPLELLRLLRDPVSGQLIVEVAGQQYTKLADIADGKVGQYVLKLAAHLLVFTNGVIVTGAGMKTVYNPGDKAGQVPEPFESPKAAPQPSPKAEAAFLASLQAGTPAPPSPPVKKGFLGLGGRPSNPGAEKVPTLNLADEINRIVQNRLRYAPLSSAAQVEITSNVGGGICINVDGQVYSSPDEVPDDEARQLIKASIQEWNES